MNNVFHMLLECLCVVRQVGPELPVALVRLDQLARVDGREERAERDLKVRRVARAQRAGKARPGQQVSMIHCQTVGYKCPVKIVIICPKPDIYMTILIFSIIILLVS